MYRDLAMTQFYCAGGIDEVAGIKIKNIYIDQEFHLIKILLFGQMLIKLLVVVRFRRCHDRAWGFKVGYRFR